MAEFNLYADSWIPVRYLQPKDGKSFAELSIREIFQKSPKIAEIAGEMPIQSVAILRLLIAILMRSQTYENGGETYTLDRECWKSLWDNPAELFEAVEEYFADYRERFNLIDRERPFMQVADLHTSKNEFKGVDELVADIPAGNDLFTTRLRNKTTSLSYAEAARWLVTLQAWDISGIKAGAVGDPRVKGGKGYPIGQGWLGQAGIVVLKGESLYETLLLNTVPTDLYPLAGLAKEMDYLADMPPWEREPADNQCQRGVGELPIATGPVDLLTWQSRRVRLQSDGEKIIGSLICQGDRPVGQLWSDKEPMSLWRYSQPKSKDLKVDTYMPKLHQSSQQVWRGLASILADGLSGMTKGLNKSDINNHRTSATIKALSHLIDSASRRRIKIETVGMEYGTQAASYEELIHDQMVLPNLLFDENLGVAARQLVKDTLVISTEIANTLGWFAVDLQTAAGRAFGKNDPALNVRNQEAEQCYYELDKEFRSWVQLIGTDETKNRRKWRKVLEEISRKRIIALTSSSGSRTMIGINTKDDMDNIDLAKALSKCERIIHKKLNEYYKTDIQEVKDV